MLRKFIFGVAAALVALGGTAYLARDALLGMAIRHRVQQGPDMAFAKDHDGIKVLICGTGSPEVSSARAQACTLVAAGGRLFLFDVGDGSVRSLAASRIPVNDLERVFITHFHSDHFGDLGVLINAGWIWGRDRPLEVQGPVGMKGVIAGYEAAYALDEGYRSVNMPHLAERRAVARAVPMEIGFSEGARSVRVYDRDGVTVDAVLVAHDPVRPALGYVLRYKNRKLFVSGDTEVSPVNLPAMQGADMVVHESYAGHMVRRAIPEMRKLGMEFHARVAERTIPYHADNITLAKQAQAAGVKRLVLTHLIPYPENAVVRAMYTQGMGDHFEGEITVAEDGMVMAF
jgi:ribonuclease Z